MNIQKLLSKIIVVSFFIGGVSLYAAAAEFSDDQEKVEQRFCVYCGVQAKNAESKFCIGCGKPFAQTQDSMPFQAEEESRALVSVRNNDQIVVWRADLPKADKALAYAGSFAADVAADAGKQLGTVAVATGKELVPYVQSLRNNASRIGLGLGAVALLSYCHGNLINSLAAIPKVGIGGASNIVFELGTSLSARMVGVALGYAALNGAATVCEGPEGSSVKNNAAVLLRRAANVMGAVGSLLAIQGAYGDGVDRLRYEVEHSVPTAVAAQFLGSALSCVGYKALGLGAKVGLATLIGNATKNVVLQRNPSLMRALQGADNQQQEASEDLQIEQN